MTPPTPSPVPAFEQREPLDRPRAADISRYPLLLGLDGRNVVVVGGGPVAARRTQALLDAQAYVTVVSPWICEALSELLAHKQLTWVPRDYTDGDLNDAWLVHTATGDRDVDDLVADECEQRRVWCVRADDASSSAAWTPAVAYGRDGITIAVGGGGDPGRAKAIRDAVAAALDTGTLPIRRSPVRAESTAGHVHLVGGGPGAPELLTVAGRFAIAVADVVVVDRLAPLQVLNDLADDVLVIDVGKAPGHHAMSQDEINETLVHHARLGRTVVRLKGGDPFVLGRGGEEAAYCRAHGVGVTVIPGVTSAVAVPAAAGIPVTHRGVATSFTVVSAHDGVDTVTAAALAADAATTLVLLMGVRLLREAASALVEAGRPSTTPVAVIERGWTDTQRTTIGTLSDIADRCATRQVTSPAVIVIGDVVALRENVGAMHPELHPELERETATVKARPWAEPDLINARQT